MHSLPPAKKRKIGSGNEGSDSRSIEGIQQLERQLTDAINANGSLNPLDDLLNVILRASDPRVVSKALYANYRVFVLIIDKGELKTQGDEAAKLVRTWIWEKLNGYVDFLTGLLKDEEKTLRISSLQILFSLLRHLSTSLTLAVKESSSNPQPQFHVSHYKKIVRSLLFCPPSRRNNSHKVGTEDRLLDPDVRDQFLETWLSVHDDIRWFFLREATSLVANLSSGERPFVIENLVSLLERLRSFPTDTSELNSWWVEELGTKPPKHKHDNSDEPEEAAVDGEEEDDWRKFFEEETDPKATSSTGPKKQNARLHTLTIHQSLHSLPAHRAVFTRAWLVLLQQLSSLSGETQRKLSLRVLNIMHQGVLPHLTRPVLVMDWVAACVDYGGAVGLLGLNTLFILMREYNLDYPSFYTRLYAFLDRDILHLKHRARFFRMTELFLSSTHLPATLLASFLKKLSRLSLNAPPAAIIMLVPFTYNILKRHPTLMGMIHRVADADEPIDPFILEEPNPNLTNALDSSLWELYSHRTHYHPAVSTLVRIFEEAFTKPGYALEDFLDHTYATLLDNETKPRIRKDPATDVDKTELFPSKNELTEAAPDTDVVAELWTFS
ncbi:CBF-domain-containing protein [Gloeophyllum trabeum ATCC 11539]|uniref:CBF-domain-containing protein n=1 Tax=Gloeophyllum trabeum (strain ATCC 11539 / FP-39264 / Madison 617) TaxID=670483 RepID=S7PX10_GLOTA|nr:CBF-domain-containing protein [Gloeophyllum trabeum ATCC 11539]EPQ52018.1 CBF-domain-containing protein [Gloeophyllum trabeum ATCC 11539]